MYVEFIEMSDGIGWCGHDMEASEMYDRPTLSLSSYVQLNYYRLECTVELSH